MKTDPVEIVRADPAARRLAFLVLAVLAVLAGLVSLLYDDPMEAWLAHIDKVAKTDPTAAQRLVRTTTQLLLALLWSFGASAMVGAVWFGRKLWRAKQWPPVGARLIHDTPVMRGKRLRVVAVFLFSSGILVFSALSFATWKLSRVLLP